MSTQPEVPENLLNDEGRELRKIFEETRELEKEIPFGASLSVSEQDDPHGCSYNPLETDPLRAARTALLALQKHKAMRAKLDADGNLPGALVID